MRIPEKLLAYSSAAGSFLFLQDALAQTVYNNIDPDIILDETGEYLLDFNADGITDIDMQVTYWKWCWGGTSWCTSGQHFDINLSGMDALAINASSALHPTPFYYGSEIGEDLFWNTESNVQLLELEREPWSCTDAIIDLDILHPEWNSLNRFLGVRFLIDGNTHYGWVRFSVANREQDDYLPRLFIQDFGYNEMPNAPAVIAVNTLPVVSSINLKDFGEFNTASDLKLSFTHAADESGIYAYRVFVFPADSLAPAIPLMESLSAEHYLEIFPTGTDYYGSLPDSILDVNGNNLIIGEKYRAIVLSVAMDTTAINNNNSIPSNSEYFDLRTVDQPHGDLFYDVGNTGTISDFKITFGKADDESNISEYRVYISNYSFIENYSALYALSSDYYTPVIPNGDNYYVVYPIADKLVYDHGAPKLYENYYAYVSSWPDMITATYPGTTSWFDHVCFNYYPYDETPVVYVNPGIENSDEILVSSSKFHNEELINAYRIYIVKKDVELTPELLASYGSDRYTLVTPNGNDIYTYLKNDQLDNFGMALDPGALYQIVISYVIGSASSFSKPSLPFSLAWGTVQTENVVNETVISNTDNILSIQFNNDVQYRIMVFSSLGNLVQEYTGNGSYFMQDLKNLPSGIYQVIIESNDKRMVSEIVISH